MKERQRLVEDVLPDLLKKAREEGTYSSSPTRTLKPVGGMKSLYAIGEEAEPSAFSNLLDKKKVTTSARYIASTYSEGRKPPIIENEDGDVVGFIDLKPHDMYRQFGRLEPWVPLSERGKGLEMKALNDYVASAHSGSTLDAQELVVVADDNIAFASELMEKGFVVAADYIGEPLPSNFTYFFLPYREVRS